MLLGAARLRTGRHAAPLQRSSLNYIRFGREIQGLTCREERRSRCLLDDYRQISDNSPRLCVLPCFYTLSECRCGSEDVLLEKPRARRYPLVATIDVTDVESEIEVKGQITDLSLFGCHIYTGTPFTTGTKVRLRIAHKGAVFAALGHVANVQFKSGMGIVFSNLEQKDQLVLEKWLAELRDGIDRPSQKIR